MGPNGAGKTTFIRILLDLIRPTTGSISVFGLCPLENSIEIRSRCGYLPGEIRLDEMDESALITKPEVLHAESNCLTKVARSSQSSEGSTMYITISPCMECAKLIAQSGITRVVYKNFYRDKKSLDFLSEFGILVEKYDS